MSSPPKTTSPKPTSPGKASSAGSAGKRSPPPAAASPPGQGPQDNSESATANILSAQHWTDQPLPGAHDDHDDDNDSSLGDDAASSTASLSSSILAYRTVHGRTYHSDRVTDAQYWTPNDENHTDAADIIHHCVTLCQDGALFQAPIPDDITHVIDVGTGTGIWAIDFADRFPKCSVIGTDISPNQPSWVPPNLKFEMDDATLPWTFPPNHFDYVHMRYLFGSVPDWNSLLAETFKACKPGGYVESYEPSCVFRSDDGTLLEGSPLDEWGKVFVAAGKKFGRPFDIVGDGVTVQDAFREAGFEEITEWEFKCPIGSWPQDKKLKEIGAYALAGISQDIEGWILFVWSQVMGWSKEEVTVFVAHLRRQLRDTNTKVHVYTLMRCVYGRKPLSAA